jgi:ribosomal protein S18 acetylase RimI-like enzyme
MGYDIRKALPEDVPQLAEVSARAFEHDPITEWLMEGDDPFQMERQMFIAEYRITKRFDLIYTDTHRMGVAIWKPPAARPTLNDRFQQVWTMLGTIKLSRRALSKIRLFITIEKAHPAQPHYYLSLLAVHPDMQGKGLGTALMQPILNICDREGIPAYLETETESNVRFYSKRGFKVLREITTSDGLSKVWTLWREAAQ